MDAIKKSWVDKTHDAILQVERYLGIKGDENHEFSMLANWIYSTEENPHGFMPAGWEGAKESAQVFASFLSTLHRVMLNEGSLLFVETEIHGSFIVFGIEEGDEEKLQQVYDKRHPSTYRRPYSVHSDLLRFFEHNEAYALHRSTADERHAERMKTIEQSATGHLAA